MSANPRRRSQRGQSLVIFALIAVVLFAIVGLAVDGGFGYYASDKIERGAMAAALAGVTDMPNLSTTPNDATSAAVAAAAKNGWTTGGSNNVAISVGSVNNPATGQPYNNRLAVTITSDVPVFFMRLLGFGTHREARTAVAEYLRPITFGQPGSQLGSTQTDLGSNGNPYFMRSEGWGTDRSQGDAYGPNPSNSWTSYQSSPNVDVHGLSGTAGTETASQPVTTAPTTTLPARGGQNYTIYVPAGQTAYVQVYNPVFAPDKSSVGTNAKGYNYHEDDTDFPENGGTCPCGPTDVRQYPIMSYTVYKSGNPFDHASDVWLSNLQVKSIDATIAPQYVIPGSGNTKYNLSSLSYYHNWVDVQATPGAGTQARALTVHGAPTFSSTGADGLTGGATGTTYRLRVDQLDNLSGDPATNGRAQSLNSQAHKGYAVEASGSSGSSTACTGCTMTALNDITLYTPVNGGGFSMPLVSIPPEYAGHTFSLYVFDPGDVTCDNNGCSNVLSITQPTNSGTSQQTAQTTDGVWAGQSGEGTPAQPATWTNKVTAGNASIETQSGSPNNTPTNLYNGTWIRFDISVPNDYASGATPDVNAANPATWFWYLSYTTANTAGDTITANLGFTGAPVHLISG